MERKVVRSYDTGTPSICVKLLDRDEVMISYGSNFTIVEGSDMAASFIAGLFLRLSSEVKSLRRRARNPHKQIRGGA